MWRKSLLLLALGACGDAATPGFENANCGDVDGTCIEIPVEEADTIFDVVNDLDNDTTVILGEGTWNLNNQVTIRAATGISLIGQGIDVTKLNFAETEAQANGVSAVGDNFLISDLTIEDAKKDGLRIEDTDGVTIQRVKVTWTAGPQSTNGAYGIYPVKVQNVLLEDSEAYNASDAGIYVGQCQNAIVRNNIASGNVAGIEIENTQFADVYGNTAEDNTGGLVVFDLPGNPVIGRDVSIHDNTVHGNNRANFAPGGTVSEIPAGTGTFMLASRRVELFNNSYKDNNTGDIAILNGLALVGDPDAWRLDNSELIGDTDGIVLVEDPDNDQVMNFITTEIYVHDNSHENTGTAPDIGDVLDPGLGTLIALVYGQNQVDAVLYDSIGESQFTSDADGGNGTNNSNDNHICIKNETGDSASFASLDAENLSNEVPGATVDDLFRPADPYSPFDCEGFTEGPIPDVEL